MGAGFSRLGYVAVGAGFSRLGEVAVGAGFSRLGEVAVGAGFSRLGPIVAAPIIRIVSYPKHLPGFSYVGIHRYSLTYCTFERQQLFRDAEIVAEVRTHFLRATIDERMAIIAYCFMPDHVHLVVEGTAEDSDLKRFIRCAKQASGYEYGQSHGGRRLWQRYGFEHVLRDEESTQRLVRYVLENPVRAGLVPHPRDYPFIGSSVYDLPELLEFAYDHRSS